MYCKAKQNILKSSIQVTAI